MRQRQKVKEYPDNNQNYYCNLKKKEKKDDMWSSFGHQGLVMLKNPKH